MSHFHQTCVLNQTYSCSLNPEDFVEDQIQKHAWAIAVWNSASVYLHILDSNYGM